jgi:hypothetical protein
MTLNKSARERQWLEAGLTVECCSGRYLDELDRILYGHVEVDL